MRLQKIGSVWERGGTPATRHLWLTKYIAQDYDLLRKFWIQRGENNSEYSRV